MYRPINGDTRAIENKNEREEQHSAEHVEGPALPCLRQDTTAVSPRRPSLIRTAGTHRSEKLM